MNKGRMDGWSYMGDTLMTMIAMNFMAGVSRSVQFLGAEENGSGFFVQYYKASVFALIFGHVIFFLSMVGVWLIMSEYIDNNEIAEYPIPLLLEVITIIVGCMIMLLVVELAGGLFVDLSEPEFANVSGTLWAGCTFVMFFALFIKAHVKDDETFETYESSEYEGIDWDKIEDNEDNATFYYVDGTVDDKDK